MSSVSPREAVYASPPGLRVPAANIYSFLFSNPFLANSLAVETAPLPSQRAHYLPGPVPHDKSLYVDSVTGATVSWIQARDDALQIAQGLRAMPFLQPAPFQEGQKNLMSPVVMILLPNCVVYAPILFGVWAAGLTASTVNPLLTRVELLHVLQLSRPTAVFTVAGQSLDTLVAAIDSLEDKQLQHHYKTSKCIFVLDPAQNDYGKATQATTPREYPLQGQDWTTLLNRGSQRVEWDVPPMTEEECTARIALIMWSSGTSGKSKGVAISHSALIWQQVSLWHSMVEYGPDERLLALAPVYHSFGITVTLLIAPLIGASCLMIAKFELESFLKIVSSFRATYIHIAPPVALLLAKSPLVDSYDLSSVKRAVSGGAPLGADIIAQVYERTKIIVSMGLGMTETTGGTAQQAMLSWEEMKKAQGSTGRLQLGFEARIVDEEDNVVKRGEPGEILLRSPMNFSCYLNDAAATQAALTNDGWYRSGDVGILDEHDNLFIVDRLKDVIKYKGLQVAPAELEAVLCACPSVKDAGVVSIYSSEEATELPRAYIVPVDPSLVAPTASATAQRRFAEEVKRYTEAHLAKYKYLRGGIVLVPVIPTSPSGKRLRKLLKGLKGTEMQLYGVQAKL